MSQKINAANVEQFQTGLANKLAVVAGVALVLAFAGTAAYAEDVRPPQPNAKVGPVAPAISDTAITGRLREQFSTDARLSGSDIHVKTINGDVTLTGTAASSDARMTAEKLARSTDGVQTVDASGLRYQ